MGQIDIERGRFMKVLCIGNNTIDTEIKTQQLSGTQYRGLLSSVDQEICDGFYQTSLFDLSRAELIDISEKFDKIIVLDQPKEQYNHPDAFYVTVSVGQEVNAEFLDKSYMTDVSFFENLVDQNTSFCIFPFIELLVNNGNTTVCCRSATPVAPLRGLDFHNNPEYQHIRQHMIEGSRLPEHCSACYRIEELGMRSARQQETVEWANRLNLKSIDDLLKITKPAYYEVRASNVCNLLCRTCGPTSSNQIEQEYKLLKLIPTEIPTPTYTDFDFVDFDNLFKMYVAGGEPTAMAEFYRFLDHCIGQENTDFELMINTNAHKFSKKFKDQISKFSNVCFIVSVDGVDELNYYVRWPSNWKNICDNINWIVESGHSLSFNITVSIYNISSLYKILSFLEHNYPSGLIHCQLAESSDDIFSPFNFPDSELILGELIKIQDLKCYKNTKLLETFVDGLIKTFNTNQINANTLKKFFEFNDLLDNSRGLRLMDYIPDLDCHRNEI
jgi:sulfatase maturation enzyme AslB (radical SAM superfamily)